MYSPHTLPVSRPHRLQQRACFCAALLRAQDAIAIAQRLDVLSVALANFVVFAMLTLTAAWWGFRPIARFAQYGVNAVAITIDSVRCRRCRLPVGKSPAPA